VSRPLTPRRLHERDARDAEGEGVGGQQRVGGLLARLTPEHRVFQDVCQQGKNALLLVGVWAATRTSVIDADGGERRWMSRGRRHIMADTPQRRASTTRAPTWRYSS
jgi:hypothetical protein